eukprot:TRINITY_DN14975_c0_g1_i1.p1 TRINITY_DN14975_c0_g1~~TRINITY_DN14975_c0_g1_i1.p1  ORF type:complete len:272 (-),score=90.13 TRINITY_DN14975_c0_g1_i1:100-915(-)
MFKQVIVLLVICFTCSVINESCVGKLYPMDPLQSGASMLLGQSSSSTSNYCVYNSGTDIDYDGENFRLVPEGGRSSTYVDLGTVSDIMDNYDISSPPSSVFTSIRYDSTGELVITQDYSSGVTVPLNVTFPAFESGVYIKPEKNHVFLMMAKDLDFSAKILFLDQDSVSATLRWTVLAYDEDNWGTAPVVCGIVPNSEPYPLVEFNGHIESHYHQNPENSASSSATGSSSYVALIAIGSIIVLLLICLIISAIIGIGLVVYPKFNNNYTKL